MSKHPSGTTAKGAPRAKKIGAIAPLLALVLFLVFYATATGNSGGAAQVPLQLEENALPLPTWRRSLHTPATRSCAAGDRATSTPTPYQEFFMATALKAVGASWLNSMFHKEMLNSRVLAYAQLESGSSVGLTADLISEMDDNATKNVFYSTEELTAVPPVFADAAGVLRMTKVYLSVGLARVYRDRELDMLYTDTLATGSDVALNAFTRALVRIIKGYAVHCRSLAQMAIDILPPEERQLLAREDARNPGVMLRILAEIHPLSTRSDVRALLARPPTSGTLEPSPITDLLFFSFLYGGYRQQIPRGKMWNMLNPTLTCSSSVRLDEFPEGARFICNGEYLLHAPNQLSAWLKPRQDVAASHVPYPHRVRGVGSNNTFFWEVNLIRMFNGPNRTERGAASVANELGGLSVFDCTVPEFQLKYPELSYPVGLGVAKLCVAAVAKPKFITISDMKRVDQESEARGVSAAFPAMHRKNVNPRALAAAAAQLWRNESQLYSFDNLTIFKVDVEGAEHEVFPHWARSTLADLGRNCPARFQTGSADLLDFRSDSGVFDTTSLLMFEIHRKRRDSSHAAALRLMWSTLHVSSMGFLVSTTEPNAGSICCSEFTTVHYRYYIKSELWAALQVSH